MLGPVPRLEGAWLWRGGRCVCWWACPGPCLTLGRVRSCCGSGGHGSPTAASSEEGEWPRFLVALRSWSLADSIALVKGCLLRQWGRSDAVPRGREAPGMARTGLGFPPKSPPSGGSGTGGGLGEALHGPKGRHRVWRAWTPLCCPNCGAAMPPPGLARRGRAAGGRAPTTRATRARAAPTGHRPDYDGPGRESLAPLAPGGGR